ncbi:MAG: hypothetical protein H0X33_13255 [Taibaiella sp.]|nr:hypothetical protein [Taibaiella sp.]
MADGIVFSIGGVVSRCPDMDKSNLDPAALAYSYLDGSPCYIGRSSFTYVWTLILPSEVIAIRTLYDTLVSSGTPVTVTIPDYNGGGWRSTTAFMTEPTGTAGGDGTANFTVQFYNLHQANFASAMLSPGGNLWEVANNGGNIEVGSSNYKATGWQF